MSTGDRSGGDCNHSGSLCAASGTSTTPSRSPAGRGRHVVARRGVGSRTGGLPALPGEVANGGLHYLHQAVQLQPDGVGQVLRAEGRHLGGVLPLGEGAQLLPLRVLPQPGVMAHLSQQPAGRGALDALGQDLRTGLPVTDAWAGEVADPDDLSRVDLAGSSGGRPVFLVEAKFWAPLRPTQPTAYFRRLDPQPGRLLLFLTPRCGSERCGRWYSTGSSETSARSRPRGTARAAPRSPPRCPTAAWWR